MSNEIIVRKVYKWKPITTRPKTNQTNMGGRRCKWSYNNEAFKLDTIYGTRKYEKKIYLRKLKHSMKIRYNTLLREIILRCNITGGSVSTRRLLDGVQF